MKICFFFTIAGSQFNPVSLSHILSASFVNCHSFVCVWSGRKLITRKYLLCQRELGQFNVSIEKLSNIWYQMPIWSYVMHLSKLSSLLDVIFTNLNYHLKVYQHPQWWYSILYMKHDVIPVSFSEWQEGLLVSNNNSVRNRRPFMKSTHLPSQFRTGLDVLPGKYRSNHLKMVWNEDKEPKYLCQLISWSNKYCVRYTKRGNRPAMRTSKSNNALLPNFQTNLSLHTMQKNESSKQATGGRMTFLSYSFGYLRMCS